MAPTRGPLRFRPVAYSPQSTAPTRGPSLRSLLWSADGTVATGRTGPPFAGSSLFSLACFSRHLVATTGRLPTAAACWRRAPNRSLRRTRSFTKSILRLKMRFQNRRAKYCRSRKALEGLF
ncbi:uncharacterized protein LOC110436977 isoform X2 [Sorghum bicolor]|uniref:uncharacterized protein LOC110436977 isoform X2 n=1 Tax=Sorghum bicolor TaxID=4558 RepID=UPI000B425B6D|nr:uncharacterized protein LOC110436977 isoform X2 [Sorghum bicolor]|eukprot:XP_021320596.1 uncharacterized protein LOC110436977 isoform X2 [Sorghum bicolor]